MKQLWLIGVLVLVGAGVSSPSSLVAGKAQRDSRMQVVRRLPPPPKRLTTQERIASAKKIGNRNFSGAEPYARLEARTPYAEGLAALEASPCNLSTQSNTVAFWGEGTIDVFIRGTDTATWYLVDFEINLFPMPNSQAPKPSFKAYVDDQLQNIVPATGPIHLTFLVGGNGKKDHRLTLFPDSVGNGLVRGIDISKMN